MVRAQVIVLVFLLIYNVKHHFLFMRTIENVELCIMPQLTFSTINSDSLELMIQIYKVKCHNAPIVTPLL